MWQCVNFEQEVFNLPISRKSLLVYIHPPSLCVDFLCVTLNRKLTTGSHYSILLFSQETLHSYTPPTHPTPPPCRLLYNYSCFLKKHFTHIHPQPIQPHPPVCLLVRWVCPHPPCVSISEVGVSPPPVVRWVCPHPPPCVSISEVGVSHKTYIFLFCSSQPLMNIITSSPSPSSHAHANIRPCG